MHFSFFFFFFGSHCTSSLLDQLASKVEARFPFLSCIALGYLAAQVVIGSQRGWMGRLRKKCYRMELFESEATIAS